MCVCVTKKVCFLSYHRANDCCCCIVSMWMMLVANTVKKFICLLIILNKIWQIKWHPKFLAWIDDNCDYMFHNVMLNPLFSSSSHFICFGYWFKWKSQANTENRKISIHIREIESSTTNEYNRNSHTTDDDCTVLA